MGIQASGRSSVSETQSGGNRRAAEVVSTICSTTRPCSVTSVLFQEAVTHAWQRAVGQASLFRQGCGKFNWKKKPFSLLSEWSTPPKDASDPFRGQLLTRRSAVYISSNAPW